MERGCSKTQRVSPPAASCQHPVLTIQESHEDFSCRVWPTDHIWLGLSGSGTLYTYEETNPVLTIDTDSDYHRISGNNVLLEYIIKEACYSRAVVGI